MRLDCEIISQDFLPVLRAVLAKELSSCGMNQKEVASILGTSQPAVSQYLRDLRGCKNHLFSHDEILSRVKDVCQNISAKSMDQSALKQEMYLICELAMNKNKK